MPEIPDQYSVIHQVTSGDSPRIPALSILDYWKQVLVLTVMLTIASNAFGLIGSMTFDGALPAFDYRHKATAGKPKNTARIRKRQRNKRAETYSQERPETTRPVKS